MTFQEALQVIERNKGLIGTTTDKGLEINALLIVPVDQDEMKRYVNSLMLTKDYQKAIVPFMSSDVQVWATDTKLLYEKGVFAYRNIQ